MRHDGRFGRQRVMSPLVGFAAERIRSMHINRMISALGLALCCGAVWMPAAVAQGPASWLTDGGDSRRTAWQQNETILTTANVKDMKLLWKIKLDNEPRQMHSLFPPLIVGSANTSTE